MAPTGSQTDTGRDLGRRMLGVALTALMLGTVAAAIAAPNPFLPKQAPKVELPSVALPAAPVAPPPVPEAQPAAQPADAHEREKRPEELGTLIGEVNGEQVFVDGEGRYTYVKPDEEDQDAQEDAK